VSKGGALGLVTLAHGLGSLSMLAVAPLSPFLLEGLSLSRVQVGLFLPAAYLGGMLFALPAGWLTERRGVRWPLVLGQTLTGGMVVLAALARDLPQALVCLFLGGLGFGVLNPTTGKAIVDWFPPRERGRAMGVKQAGLTLGGIVSAIVLPWLAVTLGWRPALGLAGLVSLGSALLIVVLYRDPSPRSAASPAARARFSDVGPFLRRPGVVVIFACGLALSLLQSGVLAYFVLAMRDTFALSPIDAGRLLALAHLGGAAGRLGWGVVSDRVFAARRRPGLAINALLGVVAFGALGLGSLLPPAWLPALAVAVGVAAFGWVGLYFALVAEIGGARSAGLLTGVAVIFAWGGILIGPPLFGLVLDVTDSYRLPWLALAATALAVAVTLPRLHPLVQRDPVAQQAA
jgi:MFS family permease